MKSFSLFVSSLVLSAAAAQAQQDMPAPAKSQQLFTANEAPAFAHLLAPRTVQYWPEEDGIVCIDGQHRFTRALYGRCDAARLETSDVPEFGLYMPYMGGNVNFDIVHTSVRASYDGMSRDYCITLPDSCRANPDEQALVLISAYALQVPGSGAIWEIGGRNVRQGVTLNMRYGAATNASFSRNGDLGVDKPDCFAFTLDKCRGNVYIVEGSTFVVSYGKGSKRGERQLLGQVSPHVVLQVAEASTKAGEKVHYMTARIPLDQTSIVAIGDYTDTRCNLQTMLMESQNCAARVVSDYEFQTPDPLIDPLEYVIPAAANGIWDEKSGVWQHGAIGWRMPLPGWRAGYTGDVLGWYDRQHRHFAGYAASQLVDVDVDKSIPVLDPQKNLARATEKPGNPMFTTGYIARYPNNTKKVNHYDMNLVYIDALLWHLNWSGDLEEAREFWPTIERHLDWEKRVFDPDDDGLYDAYCCIWASDGLYYSGGAVTHSSAYNLRANREAAKIAALLGYDKAARRCYDEADKIQKAIDESLWLDDEGVWAECKDAFGLKRQHRNPALWTVYHAIDSEVGTPLQRYRATQYVDRCIPHFPIKAEAGRAPIDIAFFDSLYCVATTSWQPYGWSINNVALAEEMHTALAYWQAGRPDEAFRLFKGALADGMYLGAAPGNIGQVSFYDAARGECYRDFGDPVGITSRTLVQGLIGMQPDLLTGTLTIRPGFPSSWDGQDVSFSMPDFDLSRTYRGDTAVWYFMGQGDFFDRYDSIVIYAPAKSAFAGELADTDGVRWVNTDDLQAQLLAELEEVSASKAASSESLAKVSSESLTKTSSESLTKTSVKVSSVTASSRSSTKASSTSSMGKEQASGTLTTYTDTIVGEGQTAYTDPTTLDFSTLVPVTRVAHKYNLKVADLFKQRYESPRSKNVTLSLPVHGMGEWCHPNDTFAISDALGLKAAFCSRWKNFPTKLSIKLPKTNASRIYLKMVGTTNPMQCRIANGEVRVKYTDGTSETLVLENPVNWWPIEQELAQGLPSYYYRQYGNDVQPPYRMSLRTGQIYRPRTDGLNIATDGGAATLLEMKLNPAKRVKTLEIECLSNDIIIGIIDAWLQK